MPLIPSGPSNRTGDPNAFLDFVWDADGHAIRVAKYDVVCFRHTPEETGPTIIGIYRFHSLVRARFWAENKTYNREYVSAGIFHHCPDGQYPLATPEAWRQGKQCWSVPKDW